MTSRVVAELGAAIRAERKRRGLTQAAVAEQAEVSREWLSRLENGAPRLEVEKVLRTLHVLDIKLVTADARPTQRDIAMAQSIAWTMSLEAQSLTDDGFNKLLDKIVAQRQAHPDVARATTGNRTKPSARDPRLFQCESNGGGR